MNFLIPFIVVLAALVSCRTFNALSSLSASESSHDTPYQTVNSEPQYAADDTHFMVYWAIWRQLSPAERIALGPTLDGAILSQREINWTTADCRAGQAVNKDGEKVWYIDRLEPDQDGLIKPIKEAPMRGFRYFSMLNVNSQHLRGGGPWAGPKKERGEDMKQWDSRRHKAYLEWLHRTWAKGTKGQLFLAAEHRLYLTAAISTEDKWISPTDYPQLTGELLRLITKYSPKTAPIHCARESCRDESFGLLSGSLPTGFKDHS